MRAALPPTAPLALSLAAFLGAFLTAFLAAPVHAALAADVAVSVAGVRDGRGSVLVAVCDREAFLGPGCRWTVSVPARAGTVEARVRGVPPGTYAIQVFHDENGNMDLDRTFIGFPKEGLGFSNDAPMKYGPPRFEDAALLVTEAGASASLTLRYY